MPLDLVTQILAAGSLMSAACCCLLEVAMVAAIRRGLTGWQPSEFRKRYRGYVSKPSPLLPNQPIARGLCGVFSFSGVLHSGAGRHLPDYPRNVTGVLRLPFAERPSATSSKSQIRRQRPIVGCSPENTVSHKERSGGCSAAPRKRQPSGARSRCVAASKVRRVSCEK